ncbi:sacsin-like isoform X2 [Ostrea edulis]|uniref:sacsin-like isoform X2 n=1 Tax=Ostrea edulis TaxID=37623 RepID=UPI0024AFA7DC|nr:sacsin-like isoform X2 [Ostrea edulis]
MEGDVESDSDDEIEYSGMIQPPLIKQLRTILSEYPDDGQILKEIIQNAEDAGASEMKILYDGRRTVQQESTRRAPFRKYFRGPALLVYNNAVFCEDDWKGIKMLYSSIKEFDRTKVGRFGLGFKSVFHITDHPLIISGKQLLVIDPHQDSSKVCQTMQLRKLHKYKKMKVEDCLETFQGVFGFDQSTLDNGHFKGTIFRFPLRENETELSDNTYDESKVNDLFMSFKDEAPVSLLFLKCLESIELLREEENSLQTSDVGKFHFSVKIDESTVETVRSARTEMRSKMQGLEDTLPSVSIVNKYDMSVCVTDDTHVTTTKTWKVMNLFKGENNMTSHLKKLSCDSSLSYSPYVGVALDMDCPLDLQGHVFCFLPLPLTEKSLSGLPIHINGCFALSQNRRVVKWPTADQIRHHAHTDKSIQWNQALVKDVLSELYSNFIHELVEESQRQGRLEEYAPIVSRCIPNIENVDEHWQILISPMIDKMRDLPVYFTPNEGGKWILKNQAVFLRTSMMMQTDEEVVSTLRTILEMYRQNTVEVENYQWDTMRLQGNQEVNPEFINMILRKSEEYTSCSDDDKFNLIRYLLSSGNAKHLEGLYLVPLHNGNYTKISREKKSSNFIHMASPEEVDILVGMEDVLLRMLPSEVTNMFSDLVKKGIYQIRYLNEANFIDLLKRTIHKNIRDGPYPIRWKISGSDLDLKWLERVWEFIVDKFPSKLDIVSHLPLIPEMVESDVYQMHMLNENLMFGQMSKNISICLKLLSVIVLGSLPDFVCQHSQLHKFIPDTSAVSILNIIDKVGRMQNWKEKVEQFNQNTTVEQKAEFLHFFSRERQPLSESAKNVLKNLKMFETRKGYVSISQNNRVLPQSLPVPYPSDVILSTDKNTIHFAKQLGAQALGEADIFKEILLSILDEKFYSQEEMLKVMKFIVEKKIYNTSNELLQLIKSVPFVLTRKDMYKKPSELFDPSDDIAVKIVLNQSMFPARNVQAKGIKVLKKLGLKSNEKLTATEIYHAAIAIHQSSIESHVTTSDQERQAAVLKVLTNRRDLFNEYVQNEGQNLRSLLMELEIIQPLQRPSSPIPNMQWFKSEHFYCKPSKVYHSKYEGLVGNVVPITIPNTSSTLAEEFGWDTRIPDLELVLRQHLKYTENYEEKNKSEYLLPVKRVYEYLAELYASKRNIEIQLGKVWMGDGFVLPSQISINRSSDDIALQPYLVPLPKEFQTYQMKELAKHLGCKQRQTTETLIEILYSLKDKHENNHLGIDCIHRDLEIIIRILNKLKFAPEMDSMNVPIPIHTAVDTKLEFRPAEECNYCNADWLKSLAEEEGEQMYFVHKDLTSDTAARLGVPSLTENLLSETEGIQEWGQTEPLTRRIKNLLKDYKDGFAIPKEIVQNADDAKATKVCFLYDERENVDCRTRLIDEQMESCQGPALWAYNDASFSQQDLENITKLSGATKADDLTKVGKFGLGFCSVYNLTDVPSFITGSNMVIFDPHAKYLGKAVKKSNPGLKIDLTATKNKVLVRRMRNQFKPFNTIFGCNLDTENPSFSGVLFRFPLRTKQQAFQSDISEKHYDENEMNSMISLYVESAGNLLLFTQHVKEIEFYHLPKNCPPDEMVLLHRVHRKDHLSDNSDILSTFGSDIKLWKRNCKRNPPKVLQKSLVSISSEVTQDCQRFCESNQGKFEAKWFISWASGTTSSLQMAKQTNLAGALPLASIAIYVEEEDGDLIFKPLQATPCGFYNESHIFCYLPLPVTTPLPVHVNGSFAVSSNRRQLSLKTMDDKTDFEIEWNQALLSDAVANAYIHLIESLGENDILCENYQNIWPTVSNCNENKLFDVFYRSFYELIIQRDSKVFCRDKIWAPLSRSTFLDPELQMSDIGEMALKATIHYIENEIETLIPLEKQILESFLALFRKLPDQLQSKIIPLEGFYLDVFLKNINDEYWSLDMISNLVLFALDKANKVVNSSMKGIECIPTSPKGTLKKPCELVERGGKAAHLFSEEDERFVPREFETIGRQKVLRWMGMMTNEIHDNLLIERISSVEIVADKCKKCGIERCKNILNYIQGSDSLTKAVSNHIKNIAFLPVLSKPNDWPLQWAAEASQSKLFDSKCSQHLKESFTFTLAKPAVLYMEPCKHLVGCSKLIVDMSMLQISLYSRNVLCKIGVNRKQDLPVAEVVHQLTVICQTVDPLSISETSKHLLRMVCADIYKHLDDVCQNGSSIEIESLKEEPCLLIDDTFVKPDQTALSIPVTCSPLLFGLNRIQWRSNTRFLQAIGVKKEFDEKDVVAVLKEMTEKHKGALDETSLNLACKLVELLAEVSKGTDVQEGKMDICIPDEDGILSPIRNLCFDDSTMLQKGESLKYIHPKIREADARKLGVQSKINGSLMKNYIKQVRPFGQREELSDRIRRILQQYPLNEGILKEMLQNADDAKATEVMFITDFNRYETEKTFCSSWNSLQGPALLVYNNSYFTENDISGIQHLGRGSKGDDPTTTGQYGVGFNSVYHITDVPSFLSKSPKGDEDTLCVMDPHCKYAPGASEISPGARFDRLNDLRKPFVDVFKCYHEDVLLQSPGTVFRLPLRTLDFAEKSDLSNKVVSEETISKMLATFESEMTKCLLFLRNVTKITVASIENGKLIEKNSTELLISDDDRKKKALFDEHIVNKATSFQKTRESREIFCTNPIDVTYFVTVKHQLKDESKWCIIQTFGFNDGIQIPNSVQDALDDHNLGLLPIGGIAMPLERSALTDATAFCFLPLPSTTGLTMHVNGHFSLDNESRRGLWKDDKKEYRTQWNYMVLEHVIAPVYTKALESLQDNLGLHPTSRHESGDLRRKLDMFHSFFPNIEKASDHYWKHFVKAVYCCIAERHMKLFLSHNLVDKNISELSCYPMHEETGNVLFNDEFTEHGTENQNIIQISKDLGVKLVDTPLWICKSIENANNTIQKFCAESVIDFLNSEDCEVKNAIRKNGQVELSKSPFKTLDRVKACLEFCRRSEKFISDVEGLPLCVLQTGNLVEFHCDKPVLRTSFSSLVPNSAENFLHTDLHKLFCKVELKCIEDMNLQKFVELLPFEVDYDMFRHQVCLWNPNQSKIPNKSWMEKLWKFLKEKIGENQDKVEVMRIIHPILPWSLIPTTQVCGTKLFGLMEDVTNKLIPVESANHVISLSSFQPAMKYSLKKINLPLLDNNCLPSSHPLRHLVASQDRIHDVLECLHVHRQLIAENTKIDLDDCDNILEYFAGGLKGLLNLPNSQTFLDKLRQLPLFTTVYDQKISLEEKRDILALPLGLPRDGMNIWAKRTRKILLRQNDRLKCIFEHFNVTEHSISEVYRVHILPAFFNIPEEKRMVHLEYIKNELLKCSGRYNEEQDKLIKAVKGIKFIPQSGIYKFASDFFSPFNMLITIMCEDPNCYPPKPFSTESWRVFMTKAGMKTEVSKDLFLEFTLQLQVQGRTGLSKTIEKKSKSLVHHLIHASELHSTDFLAQVSKIKFIVPQKIDSVHSKIYPPPKDESNHLIHFNGSVMSVYETVAWTQCRILPYWINNANVFSGLDLSEVGVQKPKKGKILTHIQTVCNHLGCLSETSISSLGVDQISRLMKEFYEYASGSDILPSELQIFKGIPFLFVSKLPRLLPCERFTLQFDEQYTMIPYSMVVPDEYFGCFPLFEKLGAARKISTKTFANTLKQIHSNDGMNANELKIAQRTMKYFFEFLPSDNISEELDDQELFLLSKNSRLIKAESLIYMNDINLDTVLTDTEKHFEVLSDVEGMDKESMQTKLKSLPERIRPKLVSDVIKSEIDMSNASISENPVSGEINDFLVSNDFVNAVLRLVLKEKLDKREDLPSDENISHIRENLRAIRLKCASGMQIVYIFQGKLIQTKPCRRHFQCNEENGHLQCLIYSNFFDENDSEKVVHRNLDSIVRAIRKCTDCKFNKTEHLLMLCMKMKNRSEIESFLVELSVPSLNKKHNDISHQLPKPGDVVEIRWHAILDNAFISFEPEEYVAYLAGTNETTGDMEYKYGIVKEKIPTASTSNLSFLQAYLVEWRPHEEKEMKAFELYKFNRSKKQDDNNTFQDFQVRVLNRREPTSDQNLPPRDNRTLDAIFKEIREILKHAFTLPDDQRRTICRRVMFQWHPDKNSDDVERATKVFQYIRKIIEKLENGENVDAEERTEQPNRSHPWSDSFFDEFERFFRREQEYQRRSHRPSSSSRSHYQHTDDTYYPKPQPYEASKWLGESKYDIRFATQSECSTEDFFNWICLISHQAAEKALIAWQYNEDSNRVTRSENLLDLARACPDELRRLASDLQILTHDTQRMRYPDTNHKPSTAYSRVQADRALELAKLIVDKVGEII